MTSQNLNAGIPNANPNARLAHELELNMVYFHNP